MNKIRIKFSSVTYALKAKEIIENNGGSATMRRNSNNTNANDCGYMLVATGNVNKLINLLNINRVKYTGYEMI